MRERIVRVVRSCRRPVGNVFANSDDTADFGELRISVKITAVGVKGDLVTLSPAGIESYIFRDGIAAISAADEVSILVIPARESKVIIVMRRPVVASIKFISGIYPINKLIPDRIQPFEITTVGVESDRADRHILGIEGHVGRGRDVTQVSLEDRSVFEGPIPEFTAIDSGARPRPGLDIASVREGIGYFGKIRIPVEVSSVG